MSCAEAFGRSDYLVRHVLRDHNFGDEMKLQATFVTADSDHIIVFMKAGIYGLGNPRLLLIFINRDAGSLTQVLLRLSQDKVQCASCFAYHCAALRLRSDFASELSATASKESLRARPFATLQNVRAHVFSL